MKRLVLIVALSAPLAAAAEDGPTPDGRSLMERGAQMLMEGLLREMEPTLDDLQGLAEEVGPALRDFAAQMGPALQTLLEEVEDWSVYHPPEVLENGDIILRRKQPGPDAAPDTGPAPDADIEI